MGGWGVKYNKLFIKTHNELYVYFWVDGVYLNARMDDRQCLLVIVGADELGRKELVAVEGGFRECEHSWRVLSHLLTCGEIRFIF